MQIELTAYISPIRSSASHDKEAELQNETIELTSFISPIVSSVFVPQSKAIEVMSSISSIVSNVAMTSSKVQNVAIEVTSILIPLEGNIRALIKTNPIILSLDLNALESHSSTSFFENQSYCEVIEL